ncbi:MAG: MoaD/ThiS family protein [Isosphaeraceae bacterium]|nr:MoaD/ThiS family protein [Isosphaeraceae bacterium]
MALVSIPAPLRRYSDGIGRFESTGTTVAEILVEIARRFPGLFARIADEGRLRRFVNVYLNDRDIRALDDLASKVGAGDVLDILPAFARG